MGGFYSDLSSAGSLVNIVFDIFTVIVMLFAALECFAGYKAMRIMSVVNGFVFGALLGLLTLLITKEVSVVALVMAVLGIAVAFLIYKFYLAGIFLYTGGGCAVAAWLVLTCVMHSYQSVLAVVFSFLIGIGVGVVTVIFVRPSVILSTAFSGAMLIVSATCMMMRIGPDKFPCTSVGLWCIVAAGGILCQYKTTIKSFPNIESFILGKFYQKKGVSFSERKYPGMQRAYRNYCIKCGCEMLGDHTECPSCGFKIKD